MQQPAYTISFDKSLAGELGSQEAIASLTNRIKDAIEGFIKDFGVSPVQGDWLEFGKNEVYGVYGRRLIMHDGLRQVDLKFFRANTNLEDEAEVSLSAG
jgi:hypothetical protein